MDLYRFFHADTHFQTPKSEFWTSNQSNSMNKNGNTTSSWSHFGLQGSLEAFLDPLRVSRALIYRACTQNQASGELEAAPAGPAGAAGGGREGHLGPSWRPTKRELPRSYFLYVGVPRWVTKLFRIEEENMRCGEIQIGGNSFRKIRYLLGRSLLFTEITQFQRKAVIIRKRA